MCEEKDYTDGSTPSLWFSRISQPPWLSGFPLRHFPPQSLPSCPLRLSPHSPQQTSPWDCFPVPMLQLPDSAHYMGLVYQFGVCRVVTNIVCVVLILFRQSQISCCTLLQAQMLPLCPNNWLNVWIWHLLQFPTSPGTVPVLFTLLFFLSLHHPNKFCVSLYSLPMVRDSCPLSAGVLWYFLHLKVCFWCTHGERCAPYPPTPPPSCLSSQLTVLWYTMIYFEIKICR